MGRTRRPAIGITTKGRKEEGSFSTSEANINAITLGGGEPVLLPTAITDPETVMENLGLDGFLFAGGGDIAPDLYDGSPHPTIYGVDRERDSFEIKAIHFAITNGLPSLFICRGMQMVTVAGGGNLISHISDEYGTLVRHRLDLPHKWHPTEHMVKITAPDSRLAQIVQKTELSTISCHHQAVRTIPPGWDAVAFAPDGIIEAVEHLYHPWAIGVQWHPELSINDFASIRLFEAFIEAACIRRTGSLVLS